MKEKLNSAKKFVKDHQIAFNVATSIASGAALYVIVKKLDTLQNEETALEQIEVSVEE